jgi:hypothetical protein
MYPSTLDVVAQMTVIPLEPEDKACIVYRIAPKQRILYGFLSFWAMACGCATFVEGVDKNFVEKGLWGVGRSDLSPALAGNT